MPFDVFLRTRLFDPLGMNDTWFYLPEDKARRLVSLQKKDNSNWIRCPSTLYDPETSYDADYPIKGAKRFFCGSQGKNNWNIDEANPWNTLC